MKFDVWFLLFGWFIKRQRASRLWKFLRRSVNGADAFSQFLAMAGRMPNRGAYLVWPRASESTLTIGWLGRGRGIAEVLGISSDPEAPLYWITPVQRDTPGSRPATLIEVACMIVQRQSIEHPTLPIGNRRIMVEVRGQGRVICRGRFMDGGTHRLGWGIADRSAPEAATLPRAHVYVLDSRTTRNGTTPRTRG